MELVKKPRHDPIDESKKDLNYPHLQYFFECKQSQNIVLPILEKIVGKTICLEGYTVPEGVCKALAMAAPNLDSSLTNRLLFNNCGISDTSFAAILLGFSKIKDFKSIIYQLN